MNFKIGGILLAAFPLFVIGFGGALAGESGAILGAVVGMLGGALLGVHAAFLRVTKFRRRSGEREEIAARPERSVRRHAVASLLLLDAALLTLFAADLENGIVGYLSGFGGSLVVGPLVGIIVLRRGRRLRGSEAVFAGTSAAFFGAVMWRFLIDFGEAMAGGSPIVTGFIGTMADAILNTVVFIGLLVVIVIDVIILTANWWWPPPIEVDPRHSTNKVVQGDREPLQPDGNP